MTKRVGPFAHYIANKEKIYLRNVTQKIDLVRAILELDSGHAKLIEEQYMQNQKKYAKMSGYLFDLINVIDKMNRQEVIHFFENDLKNWINERNKLIHGLANKKITDYFNEDVKRIAEESEKIWRFIDNNVSVK